MPERVDALIRLQAKTKEVTRTLNIHGIPLHEWGLGGAKTVRHLTQEILNGEATLIERGEDLVRKISLVKVDVRYRQHNGVELQLVEDRQEFEDGRVRRRGLAGVTEKMKPGEDAMTAARRGLAEELGITEPCIIENLGSDEEIRISTSYPGLITESTKHSTRTYVPDEAFRREYIEQQDDKRTYFVWKEVE